MSVRRDDRVCTASGNGVAVGVAVPSALASSGAVIRPDCIGKAVQVGLVTSLKPLGVVSPSRISVISFPVTDSLAETIAENSALNTLHRAVSLENDVLAYVRV